ncbi:MFS transporter [Cryobacterium zhongshanensis]|uniref:MFS transporter n=1 Tax=Cryobacterium zhongshanensis TaxID=2928153 RepID=A0AA41UGH4_9MICO|nr:MFS transporter [Cryobacterium zhongshanensis]MCI4657309.1 MFS transporter [Cryobacterium zhongshanensis]
MFVRRVFYRWQFLAVLVLPAWLLVGASLFKSSGWAVLGSFFGGIVLGLGLLAVALLFFARTEVRMERAVSWRDVGVLTLWHALIVASGFTVGASWLPLLVVLVGLAAFWFAIWELYASARSRMQAMIVLIDETARGGAPTEPAAGEHPSPIGFEPTPDPSVIVVREKPKDT